MDPLIITALLDEKTQSFFNEQRRLHFPPQRNYLDAHVTLFHALPGEEEASIRSVLENLDISETFPLMVVSVVSLGNGVAYRLASQGLLKLRAGLAEQWDEWLTQQDRNKHDIHVTVQNKVKSDVARALHSELILEFTPVEAHAIGLALWRYKGGPWEAIAQYRFV